MIFRWKIDGQNGKLRKTLISVPRKYDKNSFANFWDIDMKSLYKKYGIMSVVEGSAFLKLTVKM